MGADCSSVEKSNGDAEADGQKASLVRRCQQRMKCCGAEGIVAHGPDKPLVSALKKPGGDRFGSKQASRQGSTQGSKELPGHNMFSRESTGSTRLPNSSDGVSSFRPMRIDQAFQERVERHFKKVRRVALETVGELNHFRVFLRVVFQDKDRGRLSPSEYFDRLSVSAGVKALSLDDFATEVKRLGFTGQSLKVFFALCEAPDKLNNDPMNLVIRRERFVKRLGQLSTAGPPLRMVVRQLIATRKMAVDPINFSGVSVAERKLSKQPLVRIGSKQRAGSKQSAGVDEADKPSAQSDPENYAEAKVQATKLKRSFSLDVIAESPAEMKPAPNPVDVQPDIMLPASSAAVAQAEEVTIERRWEEEAAAEDRKRAASKDAPYTKNIKSGVHPKKRQHSK